MFINYKGIKYPKHWSDTNSHEFTKLYMVKQFLVGLTQGPISLICRGRGEFSKHQMIFTHPHENIFRPHGHGLSKFEKIFKSIINWVDRLGCILLCIYYFCDQLEYVKFYLSAIIQLNLIEVKNRYFNYFIPYLTISVLL